MIASEPLTIGDTLFLLTGSPTPKSTEEFGSALYRLRQDGTSTLAKVRDVMPQTEFILEDTVNRLLVLADLNLRQKRIEFLSEDTPTDAFGLDVPLMTDGWFASNLTILRTSSGEAVLALGLLRRREDGIIENDVWGIRTNPPDKSLRRLTPELLKHAVASGKSGLVDIGTTDGFTASVRDETGTLQLYVASSFVPTRMPAPPGLAESRKYNFSVLGLNEDLAAVTVREIVSRQPVEKSGVWVLNRATSKWTQIPTPHPTNEVRTLGSWVAIAETQPERKDVERSTSKARRVPSSMGPAIAHRMHYRHISLPGRIILFHSTDGQQLRIETGEDDTEVLAIHEGKVYYRINDQLWQAGILKDKLAPPELVFESPVIGDVHWIFWGPDEPGK